VGTALLLAAVVGSGIMGDRLAGGNVAVALLANSLATGAALVALILTFGPISGAHFNPAVSLVEASQGGLPWRDVPVYVMPGARLPDIERGAVALGVLTNHAEAGRSLALSLRREREAIAKSLAAVPPLTTYVDAGFGTSIQRTTLLARLIALAGGRLVGPADGVATVNAKALHRLDPDTYIATTTSGVTLARLRSRPGLRTLRSVAAGRVFLVDPAVARADTTSYALLHSLAHDLHPGAVKP